VTKEFDTPAEATADAEKLIQQKLKKGYQAVSVPATATKKAAAKKAAPKEKAAPRKAAPKKAAPKKAAPKKAPKKAPGQSPVERFTRLCLSFPDAYQAEPGDGRRSFRIQKGDAREFAIWIDAGDQPGGHLRHADPARLDDPRFERSRAHRGKKHNWMYVRPSEADPEQLRPVVAESYETAQKRGGGKAVTELYEPLRRGVAAAGPDHAPSDLHAAGPAAKITGQEGPSSFRLALWSTEAIQHLAPAAEKKALARGLEQLHQAQQVFDRVRAEYLPHQVRMGRGYEILSKTAESLKNPAGDSPPLVAASAATGAFRCIPGGYAQRAVIFAAEAVEVTVRALVAADADGIRRYLVELDDRILAEELVAVVAAKGKLDKAPAIVRVLWRGADEKGFPALWLVRLEGEQLYGLFWKLGRRWSWAEGRRDDVLASVPNEHFESAALTVAARDH